VEGYRRFGDSVGIDIVNCVDSSRGDSGQTPAHRTSPGGSAPNSQGGSTSAGDSEGPSRVFALGHIVDTGTQLVHRARCSQGFSDLGGF